MDKGCVVAIDIGGTKILSGLVRIRDGAILKEVLLPTETSSEMEFVNQIKHSISQVLATSKQMPRAIGIATAGYVDKGDDTLSSLNLNVHRLPLPQFIKDEFDLPVAMDNDCHAGALGEGTYGLARQARNYAFVAIGTGIGVGLVLNGELYRGHNNNAGEIGHVGVDLHGEPCKCGGVGCLEEIASGNAIARRASQALAAGEASSLRGNVTTKQVFEAAEQGDELAQRVVDQASRALGYSLRNLFNLLDLELIIIGGGIPHANHGFFISMVEAAQGKNLIAARESVIKLSSIRGRSVLLGAAALAAKANLNRSTQIEREG